MGRIDITRSELVVMNAIWKDGYEKSLMEIVDIVCDKRDWETQTISTFIKRLERRGYVSHHREGRQYIYQATRSKEECFRQAKKEFYEAWEKGAVKCLKSYDADEWYDYVYTCELCGLSFMAGENELHHCPYCGSMFEKIYEAWEKEE